MRSFITLLYITICCLLSIPVVGFLLLLGLFDKNRRNRLCRTYVKKVLAGIFFLSGSSLAVTGLENIPKDEAVLIMGNHISYFDAIASYLLWDRPVGCIAKKELKKVPFLKLIAPFIHCLFVDRSDPRNGLKMVLEAAELIENGISMVIFPEGTRSKSGKLLEFKNGSFKIATKSKCPIVPMGIIGTADIFDSHIPWLKPSTVTIHFGQPIETKNMNRQELKELPSIVRSKIAKLSEQEE